MPDQPTPPSFSRIAEDLIAELRGGTNEEPARSRKRPTQPLAELVEQLLQKHRIGREAPEHLIRDQWPTIVGTANATYSHPLVIDRNRLIVLARHSVVKNELFMHREEIADRVRKLPGCEHVKAIMVRAG